MHTVSRISEDGLKYLTTDISKLRKEITENINNLNLILSNAGMPETTPCIPLITPSERIEKYTNKTLERIDKAFLEELFNKKYKDYFEFKAKNILIKSMAEDIINYLSTDYKHINYSKIGRDTIQNKKVNKDDYTIYIQKDFEHSLLELDKTILIYAIENGLISNEQADRIKFDLGETKESTIKQYGGLSKEELIELIKKEI